MKTIPENHLFPNFMLTSNNVYLAGSAFIVHNTLVNLFKELYEKKY